MNLFADNGFGLEAEPTGDTAGTGYNTRPRFTRQARARYLRAFACSPQPFQPIMRYGDILLHMARLAASRPRVAVRLLATAWRFRARDWYRTPPYLPLPSREYLAWRMHTAYGNEGVPRGDEVERYLAWVMWMRRAKHR